MAVLAVSAVGLEKSLENESCEAPFCSCDETLNLGQVEKWLFPLQERSAKEKRLVERRENNVKAW